MKRECCRDTQKLITIAAYVFVCLIFYLFSLSSLSYRDPSDSSGAARMRDLVTWPRYMTSSQSYLKLDVTSSADVKIRESNMKFWNEEVPRLMGKEITTGGAEKSTWCLLLVAFSAVLHLLQ